MYRVGSSDFTGVGDGNGNLELPIIWLGLIGRLGSNLEIRVLECGVRQTMTEWEEGSDLPSIVVLVSDPDTFLIMNFVMCRLVVQVGRDILFSDREGDGQSTRWVDFAVHDVGNRVSSLITTVPCKDNTGDLLDPRHRHC